MKVCGPTAYEDPLGSCRFDIGGGQWGELDSDYVSNDCLCLYYLQDTDESNTKATH